MKSGTQKAPREPKTLAKEPSAAEAVAPKPPFRLPSGFAAMKSRAGRNPRAEYRQAQQQRVADSAVLAERYPKLKALKVSLEFVDREGLTKTTEMKYSANPAHAKSVLLFACPSPDCIGGDFDLSSKLAKAIAANQTKVTGEMLCQGTHKKLSGAITPCRSTLHYVLNLAYQKGR
jgi:hypothetical protein